MGMQFQQSLMKLRFTRNDENALMQGRAARASSHEAALAA